MRGTRRARRAAGIALGIGLVAVPAVPAARAASRAPAVAGVRCATRRTAYSGLATRMAAAIAARLRAEEARLGTHPTVGMEVTDGRTGVTCTYNATEHFYAASVIKVTILAALLRKAQEQHRQLSARERYLARLMITESNNAAATALWNDVGIPGIRHFLRLAGMRQTRLSYAWGLSLLTAHDEVILLTLLSVPNAVLSKASRVYERYLMGHVIASQRWGVPAGAPRSVGVHVKNGWLPYAGSWEINSVGIFTSTHRTYQIAFLTHQNPTMADGIYTIEAAAEVVHRELNPGVHAVIPPSRQDPAWGVPDETIPAS